MATDLNLLYPDFLQQPEAYDKAERYWEALFTRLCADLGLMYHPFYNKQLADGRPLRDGNPIFDAYIPERHRLVRILQHPLEEAGDELLSHWEDEWPEAPEGAQYQPVDAELRGRPVPELVIDLVLTPETAARAEGLVREWLE